MGNLKNKVRGGNPSINGTLISGSLLRVYYTSGFGAAENIIVCRDLDYESRSVSTTIKAEKTGTETFIVEYGHRYRIGLKSRNDYGWSLWEGILVTIPKKPSI